MGKVTLTESYLTECLKQARYYEFCKDCERALTVLQPFWSDIEEMPLVEDLPPPAACEVLIVCGSVISAYGTTHQKISYQQLADRILSRAREIAIEIGERDLIAESEKQIAVAYWRHGQFENAVAFLNTVLAKFTELEQLTNQICLRAQANLLTLYVSVGQPEVALKKIQEIEPFIEESDDLWAKTGFYNQAAGVYCFCGRFELAIPFLQKAIEYATLTKNNTYLGNALNNLANAHLNLDQPYEAMSYIGEAITLFLSTNQIFPYAQTLETKSQIFIRLGKFKEAMLTIGESIEILEKGESFANLCESMWTRAIILVKSGEMQQAIRQYNNIIQIVKTHLNLATEDFYIAAFSKLLYLETGSSLDEKETAYRRHLFDEALGASGGIITTAAKFLRVDHQRLSKAVSKFPDLKEKHRVKIVVRRNTLPVRGKSKRTSQSSFAVRLRSDRLSSVGLRKGQVVNVHVQSLDELDLSKPVVIKDRKNFYHCGFLIDMFGMFAFQNENGDIDKTFVNGEIVVAGQIVGVHDPNTDRFVSFGR